MTIVVAGATGFVGQQVVERLDAAGHSLRLTSRNPGRARKADPAHRWVELDVDEPDTLEPAFAGADTLIYLVHGMRHDTTDLVGHEERCATLVAEAAQRAGLRRIVYLGAPAPSGTPSNHLLARLRTGEILRGSSVTTVELRASMIIGAGSESWLIVRDLAHRLPIMVLPSWLNTRSQPVGVDDVVGAIEAAIHLETDSVPLDVPGPEILTAREILERVAAGIGTRPVMVPIPWLSPSLSSHWIKWVTRADNSIARQLVDGLTNDIIAADDGIFRVCPELERTPLDQAIRRALDDEGPLPRRQKLLERAVFRMSRK